VVSSIVWQALIDAQMTHRWWTLHTQAAWMALLVFSAVAAWFDVRERRIPNLWNLPWLVVFLVLQIEFGSGADAILAVVFTGALMLFPALLGVWGQGDWKMAMVYGAALGVLPTLAVWWLAMLLAKGSSVVKRRIEVSWLKNTAKSGMPVAVFVLMATIFLYAGMFLLGRTG